MSPQEQLPTIVPADILSDDLDKRCCVHDKTGQRCEETAISAQVITREGNGTGILMYCYEHAFKYAGPYKILGSRKM